MSAMGHNFVPMRKIVGLVVRIVIVMVIAVVMVVRVMVIIVMVIAVRECFFAVGFVVMRREDRESVA